HDAHQVDPRPLRMFAPHLTRDADGADRRQSVNHDVDHADKRTDQELDDHQASPTTALMSRASLSASDGTTLTSSSRTHAVSNSQATARIIGPMKRQTMPCASVPPITPMKMTKAGVVRPRPITMGFSTLSASDAGRMQSVIRSAAANDFVAQIQIR